MHSPEQEFRRDRSSQGSEPAQSGMHDDPSRHDTLQHAFSTPPSPLTSPPLSPDTYARHTSSLLDPGRQMSHRRRRKQDANISRGLHFSPHHPAAGAVAHSHDPLPPRPHRDHDGPLGGLHQGSGTAQDFMGSGGPHPGWPPSGLAHGQQAGSPSHAASSSGFHPAYRPGLDGRSSSSHIPAGSGVHASFGSGIDLRQLGVRRESDGYPPNAAGSSAAHALKGSNAMQRTQSLPFHGAPHQNGPAGRHSLALPGAFMREPKPRHPHPHAGTGDLQHARSVQAHRMASGPLPHGMWGVVREDGGASHAQPCPRDSPHAESAGACEDMGPWPALYREAPGMVQHGPAVCLHGLIASLHPSSTETLFALELGGRIGAVSADSAWPPEAASLPQLRPFSANTQAKVAVRWTQTIMQVPDEALHTCA